MPLNRSSSGLVGASLIVISIDPVKHFIRTTGSFVDTGRISGEQNQNKNSIFKPTETLTILVINDILSIKTINQIEI